MLLLMQVLLYHICSFKKQKSLVMVLLVYWDGVQFPTVPLLFVSTTNKDYYAFKMLNIVEKYQSYLYVPNKC